MGAQDSKASDLLGGSDSKRFNDFISKLGVEGGGGKKTRQRQSAASASSTRATTIASGSSARRPSSAPALKQPPWKGPSLGSSSISSPSTRDPVRVSQHMAPTSAGYSKVKESRGEAARVLKSAQALLDKTYNRSASALSHSQL